MRTLLAVDGSEQSTEAVRALAHMTHSEALFVVHAVDVPAPAYPMMVPEVARELSVAQERALREEGERIVNTAAALLPLHVGPVTKLIEIGKPSDVITGVAKRERIDLIVMGARGVGAVRELMLGSVSHRVVSHAPCSVLVVGGALRPSAPLVLAISDEADADAAVRLLSMRPLKEPGDVIVLTVVPYAHPAWPVGAVVPESVYTDMAAQAKQFGERVATTLSGLRYRARAVAELGSPAHEIVKTAATERAGMIVMGSHHHGLSRAMLGSVSHSVLHRVPCPVLVVRPASPS